MSGLGKHLADDELHELFITADYSGMDFWTSVNWIYSNLYSLSGVPKGVGMGGFIKMFLWSNSHPKKLLSYVSKPGNSINYFLAR